MSSETSYENGQLIVTRYFDAPREAVFDAWIATSKVQLWWGCGFATEVKSEIEPFVGGKYAHLMSLEEAGEYEHFGRITQFDPPSLLAYQLTDKFHTEPMTVRVEFFAEAHGTQVRLTQSGLNSQFSHFVRDGWSNGLEGLAQFLAGELTERI